MTGWFEVGDTPPDLRGNRSDEPDRDATAEKQES
jgi:hypothetical protein